MGPVCTPGNVSVPCAASAWEIGGSALYLKPSYSGNLGYYGTNADGGYTNYNTIGDNWDWGFMIQAGYHFNTGNDININWYSLDAEYNHSFSPTEIHHAEEKWNAVNAEFGQLVIYSPTNSVRYHAGVQYAQIKSNVDPAATTSTLASYSEEYNGFGPRVGADMWYRLNTGYGNFGIYGKAATALLVGTSRFNDGINLIAGSKDEIVPEFEAKIGLDYDYMTSQGDLKLDLGYMWFDYLNAHHQTRGVTGAATSLYESNFSASGPYLGLKFVSNA